MSKDDSLFSYYGFKKGDEKKYPVVSRILKQLTPERIDKELEAIRKVKLPPELQKWVREYEKVGDRGEFFWKFMYKINEIIKPFNVPKKYQISLIQTKFLINILIILLDDLADKLRTKRLLDEALKIPFNQSYIIKVNQLNKKEKEYLNLIRKVWCCITKIIKKNPKYEEFEDVFEYDFRQVLNAMDYAYLVNKNPYLINKTEYWLYSPHSFQGMINCSLDLMCISKFNIKELSKVREIFWGAQKIARIGNCLSTWKRELKEGDLTSGVLAYAVSFDLLNAENFRKKDKRSFISKINRSSVRDELLKALQQYCNELHYLCRKIKSIRSVNFLGQLEKLFLAYLITEKYKRNS